jgi:hypothetical protein
LELQPQQLAVCAVRLVLHHPTEVIGECVIVVRTFAATAEVGRWPGPRSTTPPPLREAHPVHLPPPLHPLLPPRRRRPLASSDG